MQDAIAGVMSESLPMVDFELPSDKLFRYISKTVPAVLTRDKAGILHIVSNYDIIHTM